MNNLGAALLQKQKQSITTSGVDLNAIQQKINALKAENDFLKAENQTLKTENDFLKVENQTLKTENESLKSGTIKKTPEVNFVFM